jgi:hypothetical protein
MGEISGGCTAQMGGKYEKDVIQTVNRCQDRGGNQEEH